jgi:enoyl-CoA hydratase/carnithine racemase
MKTWEALTETIEQLQKPVIAAVEGFCITGGWELAMACDIRVAGEGASFLLTGSRIGTVPGGGGTQRLPREVGLGRALEIHFAAEPIDGKEAYRIGAINRLVAKGRALAEAKKMIKGYEKRAPLSLAMAKRAVRAGMQMDLKSAIEYERFLVSAVYGTEDRKEGIAAFLKSGTRSSRDADRSAWNEESAHDESSRTLPLRQHRPTKRRSIPRGCRPVIARIARCSPAPRSASRSRRLPSRSR